MRFRVKSFKNNFDESWLMSCLCCCCIITSLSARTPIPFSQLMSQMWHFYFAQENYYAQRAHLGYYRLTISEFLVVYGLRYRCHCRCRRRLATSSVVSSTFIRVQFISLSFSFEKKKFKCNYKISTICAHNIINPKYTGYLEHNSI